MFEASKSERKMYNSKEPHNLKWNKVSVKNF